MPERQEKYRNLNLKKSPCYDKNNMILIGHAKIVKEIG